MPPRISIIVPCYNEAGTIQQLLEAIYQQTFPREDMEVVIADGMSQDATLERIQAFCSAHPDLEVNVVNNAARSIPSGLNCAIHAASGEFIVRMDAHSRPYPDYVSRCIAGLEAGLGENVGGLWKIEPGNQTWMARAIAISASHPLGVGDARYRIGAGPSEVDTVPFGAFRKELIDQIGMFDETLLSNEDYEFNTRIRRSGGRIWLDPKIVSIYYSRTSIPALARQYWRYGFWKFMMLLRYPETLRWRQALPPVLVASLLVLSALSWIPLAGWTLALELSLYSSMLILVGVQTALQNRNLAYLFGVPMAIATMHLAWGAGFLGSALTMALGFRRNG
jgi:glycosyltransferase involved in cell wall biosynthesis